MCNGEPLGNKESSNGKSLKKDQKMCIKTRNLQSVNHIVSRWISSCQVEIHIQRETTPTGNITSYLLIHTLVWYSFTSSPGQK